MITSLVPSSCVYVEPSLPPCRSVRNLRNFPQIFTGNFLFDHKYAFAVHTFDYIYNYFFACFFLRDEISEEFIKGNNSFYVDSSIGTTALGWGEYFGLIAPTVTATAFHLETMTLMDPNTIVTFSIKGCRPSRLPMDLGTCQNVPGLKPSPTTPEIMTSTVFKPDILPPSYVYGSESEMMATESYEATENLE